MKKMIIALLLSSSVQAQQMSEDEMVATLYIACSASNAILAEKMEPPFQNVVLSEAIRFRDYINPEYHYLIAESIENLSALYNHGQITWDELVDLAQDCSAIKE